MVIGHWSMVMPLAMFPIFFCNAFLLPDILLFFHTQIHICVYYKVEIVNILYACIAPRQLCVFLFVVLTHRCIIWLQARRGLAKMLLGGCFVTSCHVTVRCVSRVTSLLRHGILSLFLDANPARYACVIFDGFDFESKIKMIFPFFVDVLRLAERQGRLTCQSAEVKVLTESLKN